jgi:hypothetical protein
MFKTFDIAGADKFKSSGLKDDKKGDRSKREALDPFCDALDDVAEGDNESDSGFGSDLHPNIPN